MVRIYQVYKSLGRVEKLTKRDLRRLARILLEEYMRRTGVVNSMNSTGGAMARHGVDAGPRGFEPRTTGLGGRRPILARPRALPGSLVLVGCFVGQ